MFNHPIVNLYFFLSISLVLVFSNSFYSIFPFLLLLLVLCLNDNETAMKAVIKFLPSLYFLPFMLIVFVIMSSFFTQMKLYDSLELAVLAFLKLSMIIILMNFYLVTSSTEQLIISLRSIWLKTKLKWKWVDDYFLFLSLVLRLYPTFQTYWINNKNSQEAIGIKFNKSYFGKLIDISKELPGMLVYQLNRSDDIALAMKLRGYGQHHPRNVIYPIKFSFFNFIQIALIIFLSSYLIGLV